MSELQSGEKKRRNSIFLSERFMAAVCAAFMITGLASLFFIIRAGEGFAVFETLTKMITAGAMYLAFKFFRWDAAKGLMGGVLLCLLYQEAHFVIDELWGEQNFDVYLVAGVEGSLYIAAAGMSFLMTVIITINHFFINYAFHGNPKNVILSRMAFIFKFAVYLLLLGSNSHMDFSSVVLWKNALLYLMDSAMLLLVICVESQIDGFKVLRHELLVQKRQRRREA